jgi:hypothetical protein
MAKTLNEFKKEFEAIKKLTADSAPELQSLGNNLGTHRDYLREHFPALGLRIHALRDGGNPGTTIQEFMGDKEVALMVKELSNRRETAKKEAVKAGRLRTSAVRPVRTRTKALEKAVTDEIAARKKLTSSKALGLNQSVKEMEPLLAQIKAFKQTADYEFIASVPKHEEPGQYDRQYASMLNEELTKSKDVAVKAEQLMLKKQKLADKNLKLAGIKAKAAALELNNQAKLAQAAHKAKDVPALAAAKKAGAAALTKLKAIVDPYQALMKDSEIIDSLSHSPEQPAIDKGTQALFHLLSEGESTLEDIQSRRMV